MDLTNFTPQIIKYIFSQKEYDYIYDIVNHVFDNDIKFDETGPGYFNVEHLGYFAVVGLNNNSVYDKVKKLTEEATGLELETPEIHFARYTKRTGHPPKLSPHYDIMLNKNTITVSIQLESSLPWDIVANGVNASLEPNLGIVFSGSHQYHWRPDIEFGDDDFFDIMVCQMTIVGSEDLPEGHKQFMEETVFPKLQAEFKL